MIVDTKKDDNPSAAHYSAKDAARAQLVKLFPGLASMRDNELTALSLNPDAVRDVASKMEYSTATGTDSRHKLNGWSVVAKSGIDRFFDQLAPLDALSTTYSQDVVVAGHPNVKPKLEVPVYDSTGEGAVDDYSNMDTRASGGSASVEVVLHKVDDVIEIYARDIERGVDPERIVNSMLSRVANTVQKVVFSAMAIGAKQGDDDSKSVTALTIPAIGDADGQFNFAYANKILSESIQPRVNGLMLDSAHYGALKASDRQAFDPSDVDVDRVAKVAGLSALGDKVVGLAANQRGAAIAFAAPYMMQGAYASHTQLLKDGIPAPISICTYFVPGLNCLKVWAGVYVGCTVTDVTAIKPLQEVGA